MMRATASQLAAVHEVLQGPPGIDQGHPGIIDDLTVLVPRVLVLTGAKGKRGMDDITIDIVDLQSPAAPVKGGSDPLGTMIRVP